MKPKASAERSRLFRLEMEGWSDERLANVAATLIFIWMGPRALKALTKEINKERET